MATQIYVQEIRPFVIWTEQNIFLTNHQNVVCSKLMVQHTKRDLNTYSEVEIVKVLE